MTNKLFVLKHLLEAIIVYKNSLLRVIVLLVREFFTPALANGFLLVFE